MLFWANVKNGTTPIVLSENPCTFDAVMKILEHNADTDILLNFRGTMLTYTWSTQSSHPTTKDFRRKSLCIPHTAALN